MKRLLAFAWLWVGCPAPGPEPVGEVCPTQTNDTIPVCQEAYAEAPYVRLPADPGGDHEVIIYAGIQRDANQQLVLRGRSFTTPLDVGSSIVSSELSSNRYGYTVYKARIVSGTVQSLDPVVRIDDRVFSRLLAGKVLEGTASARVDGGSDDRYDYLNPSVPMRIRFDAAPSDTESDRDTQFPRYALGGRVENATGGVRASDGGCFPALSTLGAASPLYKANPASDRVVLLRHPNMHGGADDVFTLGWPQGMSAGNNMGGGLFVSVTELMRTDLELTEASTTPHGVPWGAPSTEMSVVTGGGATCP